jgi:cytochrome P450
MQRRPDIYPDPSTGFPDPLDFAPERFESWSPKIWTYVPFNGGPRLCLGQQFALTEMGYTIVRILQTFSKVEPKSEGHPGFQSDIVLAPAHGVHVAFRK